MKHKSFWRMSLFSVTRAYNKHQALINELWQLVAYFSFWHWVYGELLVPRVLDWRNVTFMLVISSPLQELLGFLSIFATMLYAFTPCFLLTDLQLHVMSKFSIYSAFHICQVPILLLCSPKKYLNQLCSDLHLFKLTICPFLHLCAP